MNSFKRIDYAEILDNRERRKNAKGTLMKLCPEARLDFIQADNEEYLYDLNIRDTKTVNWTCHICGYKRRTSVTRRVEKVDGIYRMKMCNICKNDPDFPYKKVYPTVYSSIDTERTTTSFYELTREDSVYVYGKEYSVKIVGIANTLKKKINNGEEPIYVDLSNTIAVKYPEIVKEWSPNNKIGPDKVSYGSETPRLWICEKGHEYPCSPKNKFLRNFRCSVCYPYGVKFKDAFPEYVKYYSPNNTIPIEELVKCDNRSTLWICENGHEQPKTCETIAYDGFLCRKCYEESIMENTQHLTDVYPQIRIIWDYDKNEKTPDVIPLSSRDTFYFKCSLGHEYPNEIRAVLNNNCECLVCTNKKVVAGYNDFKSRYPDLVDKLSPELQKVADRILGVENKYLDWICSVCGGEYQDTVRNIASGIDNCPYCSDKRVLYGFNDFITKHPELSEELYLIGNYMIGTDLSQCLDTSNKTAYWICLDCKHIYPMRIADRVTKQERGHNPCPRCNYISKKKIFVF